MNCPKCHAQNDLDATFCEQCGSPLPHLCRTCDAALKPGARFCNQCGAAVDTTASVREQPAAPETAPRQADGERKPITILFTDIVGSTALAEMLDPEAWKEIVSGAHRIVASAVNRYEGTIAQLLGDGVLVFFGAPVTHEEDPLRAVLAALEIQQEMKVYEQRLQGVIERLQMRIGINTGLVVVGSVGSAGHLEYLAIGDAVNLAARLQSACRPGSVLLSEATAHLVGAAFALEPLGEIEVKGKLAPVAVFEVKEVHPPRENRRSFVELRSPLVGRNSELTSLQAALDQLKSGLGQIVSVVGEAGIGKSRLVDEACYRSGCGSGGLLRVLEGRALSYGQKLSFWTIRQLIQADLQLSDGDPELKIRLALRRRLQTLFGEDAGAGVYPYIGSVLGIQLQDEAAEQVRLLDGETLKYQTLQVITRYFTRLAEERPTVLIFDDLHWSDPSSLEALDLLLPVTDNAPLMLLTVSRLEREHASWRLLLKAQSEFAHRYTGIMLQPLSGEEQNRLVDNLLAIADLPEVVRIRILERAEGNPLFLEEIVRQLIDQGAIVREGERWRATGSLLEESIPDTLRGVLLARIDRLQEDVRRTLQLASVIGKSFLYSLLAAIGEAEQQLAGQLAMLQRLDLVREKSRLPELEYMFKHSLTQEAAYHSMLLEQRRMYHRRVGIALEALFAGRLEEFTGLLAYHFDAAGETHKALDYLIQAGDRARISEEPMEAVGYYRRVVELLEGTGDNDRLAKVWLKLGLVYHANFQFEETYQAYEQAFALKQRTQKVRGATRTELGQTLRILGVVHYEDCYDPGSTFSLPEGTIMHLLFAGLVAMDDEMNVLPEVARSWQVVDDGYRYLFHLRRDVRWTDGTPVTAHDFEYAWKRNLHPSQENYALQLLYVVRGARTYHEGRLSDPDCVAVRASDDWTLEVTLERPAAYFPYIVTHPVTFPLPRWVVERCGAEWWRPGNIQSNGQFRLVSFDPETGVTLERNPRYFGEVAGNVRRIQFGNAPLAEREQHYRNDRCEIVQVGKFYGSSGYAPPGEVAPHRFLVCNYFVANPMMSPMHDLRLRRALAQALDWEQIFKAGLVTPAYGGLVPPGMAGYTPDLRLRFDPDQARALLVEAGYPGGSGLPVIQAVVSTTEGLYLKTIIACWHSVLGIQVQLNVRSRVMASLGEFHLVHAGWIADFPDPDTFLRQSSIYHFLQKIGWQDPEYDHLVETAAGLKDRKQRLALYRQADHRLVVEQAIIIPVFYSGSASLTLVKPWVKNYKTNLLGDEFFHEVTVDEH